MYPTVYIPCYYVLLDTNIVVVLLVFVMYATNFVEYVGCNYEYRRMDTDIVTLDVTIHPS